MKALCLLGVLVVARLGVLTGQSLPAGWASCFVCFWQDLLVVLIFGCGERLLRGWRGLWVVYGATALVTALNVPLFRLFGSPLNPRLLAAARPELGDSIQHHLTAGNLVWMVLVLGTAVALPWVVARLRLPKRTASALWVVGLVLTLAGFAGGRSIDTGGFHRNGLVTLWPRPPAKFPAAEPDRDWRASPFGPAPGPQSNVQGELASLRGRAAGWNLVLVLLESTGARHAGPWREGGELDPTPNLTALSRDGVLWENAYAVYPESIRGLFSVMRSRYPPLDAPVTRLADDATPSLAWELGEAGYATGLFHAGRFDYLGMRRVLDGCGFDTLEDAGDIGGEVESSFGVDEPAVVARLLEWVDELPAGQPFFGVYLPIAGHHPYEATAGGLFDSSTDAGRHANAVHAGDAALGRLLAGFRSRGLLERTVFVIAGDHGEAFGEHPGNHGHTLHIREENVRVPLLIAAPGLIQGPLRAGGMASLVDCAPTALELLGRIVPDEWQGLPLWRGAPEVACFLTDYDRRWLGLRDGRWKFLWDVDGSRAWLHDLAEDPGERHNRAGDLPERVERYRRHVVGWAAAQQRDVEVTAP